VVECNLAKVEVVGSNPISRSKKPSGLRGFLSFSRCFATVAIVSAAGGCAHHVRVESNVPTAEVRVDGVVVGRVGAGATFVERAGPFSTYDIEVSADGYRTARRRVSPSIADPWVGIPAMCSMITGCAVASFAVPVSLVVVSLSPDDRDVQCLGWGCAAASTGWAGGSAALAAWGGQRLPDVITIPLEPVDEAMAH
jgi:hypothetical protein